MPWSHTWDFEDRLTVGMLMNFVAVNFTYDPFGRRIKTSTSTSATIYVYDGANLIEETDGAGNAQARFTFGPNIDEPLAQLRSGTTSYYQADGLGSITSLSNTSGALANTYTYGAFGLTTGQTGSVTNWFRYTGREFNQENGIYYYRARYYEQNLGRFISEDPTRFGAGMNFYAYVNNAPADSTDPSGLLRVCCRPLRRYEHSPFVLARLLNVMIISHFRHCYIELTPAMLVPFLPSVEIPAATVGVHPPPGQDSGPQTPQLNQATDNLDEGGECKDVTDATPCKFRILMQEIQSGVCYSCGKDYHNGVASGHYNNSNTYVFDLISGAGMTPPPMSHAPGYHSHRK